mmetsp:Transcript_74003/g.217143  ORF Transcript_74003/g.217143 Transcript_74003/m.217143 type:complete len:162 (-) Transcript_74003:692-1177(-)
MALPVYSSGRPGDGSAALCVCGAPWLLLRLSNAETSARTSIFVPSSRPAAVGVNCRVLWRGDDGTPTVAAPAGVVATQVGAVVAVRGVGRGGWQEPYCSTARLCLAESEPAGCGDDVLDESGMVGTAATVGMLGADAEPSAAEMATCVGGVREPSSDTAVA